LCITQAGKSISRGYFYLHALLFFWWGFHTKAPQIIINQL
jgi:hypothetical protein